MKPEGWLQRELALQGTGLSGNFDVFWEPVRASRARAKQLHGECVLRTLLTAAAQSATTRKRRR